MVVIAVMCMAVIAVLVAMRVALDVDVAGHDEKAPLDAHHFDLRAIEARKHRAGDDLVDRADHRRAAAEIEHAVDRVDQRIEFVGAEDDGDLRARRAAAARCRRRPSDAPDRARSAARRAAAAAADRAAPGSAAGAGARRPRVRRSSGAPDRARRHDRAPSRFRAASPCRAGRSRSARRPPRWRRSPSRSDAGPAQARGSAACSRSPNCPRVAGRPRTRISPDATGVRPSAARISVVLPAPFGAEHADELAFLDRRSWRPRECPGRRARMVTLSKRSSAHLAPPPSAASSASSCPSIQS